MWGVPWEMDLMLCRAPDIQGTCIYIVRRCVEAPNEDLLKTVVGCFLGQGSVQYVCYIGFSNWCDENTTVQMTRNHLFHVINITTIMSIQETLRTPLVCFRNETLIQNNDFITFNRGSKMRTKMKHMNLKYTKTIVWQADPKPIRFLFHKIIIHQRLNVGADQYDSKRLLR